VLHPRHNRPGRVSSPPGLIPPHRPPGCSPHRRGSRQKADNPGPGDVGRQHQGNILMKLIEALYQIFNTPGNILLHIKGGGYSHQGSSPRHELHKSHGAFRGYGPGVKSRFLANDGLHQILINPVPFAWGKGLALSPLGAKAGATGACWASSARSSTNLGVGLPC
jgi:hypothetical protein